MHKSFVMNKSLLLALVLLITACVAKPLLVQIKDNQLYWENKRVLMISEIYLQHGETEYALVLDSGKIISINFLDSVYAETPCSIQQGIIDQNQYQNFLEFLKKGNFTHPEPRSIKWHVLEENKESYYGDWSYCISRFDFNSCQQKVGKEFVDVYPEYSSKQYYGNKCLMMARQIQNFLYNIK